MKIFKQINGRLVPISLFYLNPPIPLRTSDWIAWYDEDHSDNRSCGWGRTAEDAAQDLVDSYEEPE